MFEDEDLAALGRNFVTVLTRVPDAYRLVRQYRVVRPGLLLLTPDGEKFGFVALSNRDPEGSCIAAKRYLRKALLADAPLADQEIHGGTRPLMVQTLTREGQARGLGIRVDDVIWAVDDKRVTTEEELKEAIEAAGEEGYKLTVRRFRETRKGALVLKVDKARKPVKDEEGNLQWDYEELTFDCAEGALGVGLYSPDSPDILGVIPAPLRE